MHLRVARAATFRPTEPEREALDERSRPCVVSVTAALADSLPATAARRFYLPEPPAVSGPMIAESTLIRALPRCARLPLFARPNLREKSCTDGHDSSCWRWLPP